MQYNIISADGHVDLRYLPGDVFVANAPAKWKDQVPRIIDTDQGPRWYAVLSVFQLTGAEYLSAIVFSGALERYPGMKFVLGECGVGWLSYVLSRMDEEYEDQFRHLPLTMKPSEYWHRQGYTTFQHEPNVAALVHMVGEDNIMWGADYPHPDGVWPDSLQIIEEDLGSLSASTRRKITCENAGKLYGLL